MTALPEAVVRACNECPWRRDSAPGWLGPYTPEQWRRLAHSDEPIACHKTLDDDDTWEGAYQCRGAATYRANVGKLPRDPNVARTPADREAIFASPTEFLEHHS